MSLEIFDDESYTFYMMQESLSKTNFWSKQVGDEFNIERCVRAGDRLDGHIVTGHIDTTWSVTRFEQLEDESWILWVKFDKDFSKYTVHKWSIALNGTSLTLSKDDRWYIEVSLIPITLSETNLGNIKLWDIINIVIRWGTTHYDMVAWESARGITDVSLKYKTPIINAILTCENQTQVEERINTNTTVSGLNLLSEVLKHNLW